MSFFIKKIGVSFSVSLILVGALVQTASAQSGVTGDRNTLFFDSPPSVDEMARHLFPSRSRGIVVPATKYTSNDIGSNASTSASSATANGTTTENAIGMPVLFHFGKTALVEASKPFLDQVGKLMSQPDYLRETLIVEGHTDAVGSNQYNHSLSELRALAVKDYLVSRYDIDPKRIFPQGMGETKLFNTQNPNSQENRRVEFLRFDG